MLEDRPRRLRIVAPGIEELDAVQRVLVAHRVVDAVYTHDDVGGVRPRYAGLEAAAAGAAAPVAAEDLPGGGGLQEGGGKGAASPSCEPAGKERGPRRKEGREAHVLPPNRCLSPQLSPPAPISFPPNLPIPHLLSYPLPHTHLPVSAVKVLLRDLDLVDKGVQSPPPHVPHDALRGLQAGPLLVVEAAQKRAVRELNLRRSQQNSLSHTNTSPHPCPEAIAGPLNTHPHMPAYQLHKQASFSALDSNAPALIRYHPESQTPRGREASP